ncbi:MAG: DUF427 domain-containing protein [Solirubrobacteraceae bacterium]
MERVWDYPRPPALARCAHRVRVELDGEVLAESARALRVLETSHPPTIYFPPDDVRGDLLAPSAAGSTWCEFKGVEVALLGSHPLVADPRAVDAAGIKRDVTAQRLIAGRGAGIGPADGPNAPLADDRIEVPVGSPPTWSVHSRDPPGRSAGETGDPRPGRGTGETGDPRPGRGTGETGDRRAERSTGEIDRVRSVPSAECPFYRPEGSRRR